MRKVRGRDKWRIPGTEFQRNVFRSGIPTSAKDRIIVMSPFDFFRSQLSVLAHGPLRIEIFLFVKRLMAEIFGLNMRQGTPTRNI